MHDTLCGRIPEVLRGAFDTRTDAITDGGRDMENALEDEGRCSIEGVGAAWDEEFNGADSDDGGSVCGVCDGDVCFEGGAVAAVL